MPGDTASDAGFCTEEEMYHCLREILDKIGIEISDLFHSCEN
jgi:hypothetical protein